MPRLSSVAADAAKIKNSIFSSSIRLIEERGGGGGPYNRLIVMLETACKRKLCVLLCKPRLVASNTHLFKRMNSRRVKRLLLNKKNCFFDFFSRHGWKKFYLSHRPFFSSFLTVVVSSF